MKRILTRRAAVIAGVLLLGLFLVRPRVGRLRGTVAQAIARGVGRRVDVSSIHLRLLPRPGFELQDLVIHDDPQFGVEPLLRAPEVTAWLRVGALLRGHIQIASLSLNDASLNLTKNQAGRWNLEDLIERTSHTTLAPTGKDGALAGPNFPYIEVTRGRINFKVGPEKTHFALTNAEFALWQDSPDTWGARLKAAPIRTDANLTDTGVISLNGTWRRSAGARQTPLQFSFEWQQAQVGQVTRLFYGSDKEWRGGLLVSGSLSGTPEKLQLSADASIQDFRQRNVIGEGQLHLATHCDAQLNLSDRAMTSLDCLAPAGGGFLELKGDASGPKSGYIPFSTYDFWLVGSHIPADRIFGLARHSNTDFDSDIAAAGEIGGSIEINRENAAQPVRLQGNGSTRGLELASASTGAVVHIGTLAFALAAEAPNHKQDSARFLKRAAMPEWIIASNAEVQLGPVNLAMGKNELLRATAVLSPQGYNASVKGEGGVERLLQTAHLLGIPATGAAADGDANLDLSITGRWAGDHPLVLGKVQLHNVHAQVRGLNAPLEISNARLVILRDAVQVDNLTALAAGSVWNGSLQIPRPCALPEDCVLEFNLRSPSVNTVALNGLLNPSLAKKPWYRFLPFDSSASAYLVRARASGKVVIDQLQLGKTSCSNFSAALKMNGGVLKLSNFAGDVLGGRATGDWTADFSEKVPYIAGNGRMENIALGQIAQLMHSTWISGTGTADYDFWSSGTNWQDLLNSADVRAEFHVGDSTFPHVVLVGRQEPLRADDLFGNLHLHDGQFEFRNAKFTNASGTYTVSGTAALTGALAIKITNESSGFNVGGTLAKTRVSSIPTAQAALKR